MLHTDEELSDREEEEDPKCEMPMGVHSGCGTQTHHPKTPYAPYFKKGKSNIDKKQNTSTQKSDRPAPKEKKEKGIVSYASDLITRLGNVQKDRG
ncbi:hypothetical protein SUGI_0352380 [Cryptomeria japonica]|nr:hypothetical protein SUGI_0352380 [Cryptomeria japonica]